MINMELSYLLLFVCLSGFILNTSANDRPDQLFDYDLYESVIDRDQCTRQVLYMQFANLILYARFLEAGLRFPRGLAMLTVSDLGNYHQCLQINDYVEELETTIEGKYCFIRVPFDQTFQLPFDFNLTDFLNRTEVNFNNGLFTKAQSFLVPPRNELPDIGEDNPLAFAEFSFGICLPKPCTSQEWVRNVLFNVSAFGFEFREQFCRLPDDKPFVTADYVAIGVFSTIGLITILSTMYDINHIIIQKKDPKKANIYCRIFSVYTNTKRLLTFAPNANALECLDGIRVISMIWVVVGHCFSMYNFNANLTEAIMWLTSARAIWVSTGLFVVDSFFLMAGLLLVYTSVGKMTGTQLLQRLHAFYLNRLLRMFPLLAALVLLEASVYHRVADGPYWINMAEIVQNCRTYWWSTLLHVQNYVNPDNICIQHSWYIAIDIQLHIVSPLVLYWVLSKNKRSAWAALLISLFAVITGSTIWNFIKELPASNMSIVRLDEQAYYMNNYYMVAWCRAAPFFIGMIVGYILNITKEKKLKLNMGFVLTAWVIGLGMIASCFYTSFMIMELDWDNQVGDSLFNSFMRVVWSIGLSWIIFACVKGYGGPINWLLTLNIWKVPARVSFAIYLYHYAICFIVAGVQLNSTYFSVGGRIFDCFAIFSMTYILAFFMTVVIDAPFSILTKMLMEGVGNRRPRKPAVNDNTKLDFNQSVITTLDKSSAPNLDYLEKSGPYLEKNGPPVDLTRQYLEKNGDIDAVDISEPLPPSK